MIYQIIASIAGMILVGSVGYSVYSYNILQRENIGTLARLEEVDRKNLELIDEVRNKEDVIESLQNQILELGGTIVTLEKLAKTDEELLKKYSKVYFLSENYRPAKLVTIGPNYLLNTENAQIHAQVWPRLELLLELARSKGIELLVASAFRSFDTQSSLKSEYRVIYGAGAANQFSADQGYSEHQLGTAVDFTTANVGGAFSSFENDPAYEWLLANAYKYGFVLSYPEGNAYYKFEPWHWRYVGVELAKRLYINKEYFYDLGQREIDEYLVKLFD